MLSTETSDRRDCLIIGAGMAGLMAANRLVDGGKSVTVVDKGHRPGGRMTTRHLWGGCIDTGAQYMTARDFRFRKVVDQWVADGLAKEWGRGFIGADGVRPNDRYPRLRIRNGMQSLAEHMAEGLDVRLETRVKEVWWRGDYWELTTETGEELQGDSLIMTAPIPQSLDLIDAGNFEMHSAVRSQLEAIRYFSCIALLAKLDGPSGLPEPGGLHLSGNPVDFLADNRIKGISPGAWTLTVHAGRQFSAANWESDDQVVAEEMIEAIRPHLDSNVVEWQVKRWRYSGPTQPHEGEFLEGCAEPALLFAGDAFGGAKVEGAALSGMAVADRLLAERPNFLKQLLSP